MLDLAKAELEMFAPLVKQGFDVVLTDGRWPLTLEAVRPLGEGHPGAMRKPFALQFRSAQPMRLPQGIYRLENAQLGAMEIFLVQTSPSEAEAIFN